MNTKLNRTQKALSQLTFLALLSMLPQACFFSSKRDDSSSSSSAGSGDSSSSDSSSGAGSGSSGGTTTTYKTFVYSVSYSAHKVDGFEVGSSGALTALSTSPATGVSPSSMCITSDYKFMYVPSYNDGTVSIFSISSTTGLLTAVSSSPTSTPLSHPTGCAITPDGKFIYISHSLSPGKVSAWSINSSTGALTELSGSPYTTTNYPANMTTSRSGNYLYAICNDSVQKIRSWTVNASTGALTVLDSGSGGMTSNYSQHNLLAALDDSYLYFANSGFGIMGRSTITSGALQSTETTSLTGGSVGNQHYAGSCMTPNGSYMYVADMYDSSLSGMSGIQPFSISGTTLTSLTRLNMTGYALPLDCSVTPDGGYVYMAVANSDNLRGYSISSSTGELTELSGSPFATTNIDPEIMGTVRFQQ